MNVPTAAMIIFVKTFNLIAGGLITYYAYTAYRRTDSTYLRALAVGFGFVTLGALVAGVVDQLLVFDSDLAIVVEGAFTAVGLVIILYSIHM